MLALPVSESCTKCVGLFDRSRFLYRLIFRLESKYFCVISCYFLLSVVIYHYPLLFVVTCYPLLFVVICCYPLLFVVIYRYPLLFVVVCCYPLLFVVISTMISTDDWYCLGLGLSITGIYAFDTSISLPMCLNIIT